MATPKMQVLLADEFLRRLLQALITQTGVDGCSALAVAPEYFTFSFEGEDPIAPPELIAPSPINSARPASRAATSLVS